MSTLVNLPDVSPLDTIFLWRSLYPMLARTAIDRRNEIAFTELDEAKN